MEHSPSSIVIDCNTCVMFESAHCAECVVTYLCSAESMLEVKAESTAVVFDLAELRAMKVLAEAGLVPTLRHQAVP
jgi:hypothetical protein